MKLEDQVVSLELAKRLKKLSVKQESLFYWEKCPENHYKFMISHAETHNIISGEWGDCHILENQENYSAFTVAELGCLLPGSWSDRMIKFDKIENSHEAELMDGDFHIVSYTEANARGEMLIYLIENKLMEIK